MDDKKKKRKKKQSQEQKYKPWKQFIPGKGRWLKKLLFDVEGEIGTDNRKKIK